MAVQGTPLIQPYQLETPEHIAPYKYGDLVVPWEAPNPDGVSVHAGRFPVPPVAWAFLTDVDFELELDGLTPPYLIVGAVYPESHYLEPTIGQIWPR